MNIYQKLVVIILECLLLNSCDIVKGLVNNHQNIFNMLVERSYSYRIIGLILVLLN